MGLFFIPERTLEKRLKSPANAGFVQKPTIADGLSKFHIFGVPEQAILDIRVNLRTMMLGYPLRSILSVLVLRSLR